MKRIILRSGFVLVFLLVIGEVGLRFAGYGNFPIYDADTEIGYVPKPSQLGVFAGGKDWALNERSMLNSEAFTADPKRGVLVLGDSTVWGGVAYTQAEKVGPALQAVLGNTRPVWSVGAGSWAILNELTWLRRNPDVVSGVSDIVWLINWEDFEPRSQWASEFTHPRSRPLWLGGYLGAKFLDQRGWWPFSAGAAKSKTDFDATVELQKFCETVSNGKGPQITLVWYPPSAELAARSSGDPVGVLALRSVAEKTGARFRDLRKHPLWDLSVYKDTVHPTAEGNRRLAVIISEWLSAN